MDWSVLANIGTFLQGVAAVAIVLGGFFAWVKYRQAKRIESIKWITDMGSHFYQFDKIDAQTRYDFEYEFFNTFAPAMEKWLVYPERMDAAEKWQLTCADSVLNFFELICHVSEKDCYLHQADREATFQYWFDDVIRHGQNHVLMRLYVQFGFENLRKRTGIPHQTSTYIAVYGTLMSGVTAQISDPVLRAEAEQAKQLLGRFVGPCEIPGTLYDLGQYPGLVLGSESTVYGELYELPFGGFNSNGLIQFREHIAKLDVYEGYDPAHHAGSEYIRRYVMLRSPLDTGAWVYVLNTEWNAGTQVPLPSGDWRQR